MKVRNCLFSKLLPTSLSNNGCRFAAFVVFTAVCLPVRSDSLMLAGAVDYWQYREFSSEGRELDREQGIVPAMALELNLVLLSNGSFVAGASQAEGDLAYDGKTQTGRELHTTTEEQLSTSYAGWEQRFALAWSLSAGWYSSRWVRGIRATQDTVALNETYRWQGPLLKLRKNWKSERYDYSLTSELRYRQTGTLVVDLAAQGFGRPEIPLQGGGSVTLIAEAGYRITPQWRVAGGPALEWRYFPRSENVSAASAGSRILLAEPASRLLRLSGNVSLTYYW